MSIPFVAPFIEAKPVDSDISFSSRAEMINALPQLLEVVLSSPTGLTLVNIGEDEPPIEHRNKPWIKPNTSENLPPSIYVWNSNTEEWEDIAPTNAATIMGLAQEALAKAMSARTTALEAKTDADTALVYVENSETKTAEAVATAEVAQEEAENSAVLNGGVYFGHCENITISGTVGELIGEWIPLNGPPWSVPKLKTNPPPVVMITLSSDSHPETPFRYGAQVAVISGVTNVRVVGYNIYALSGSRTVSFMWLIKGEVDA